MKITPAQAEALARFLLTIRPDWSRFYTTEAVRGMRHINDDLEAITAAAVRGALSPKIAKPDVLAMNGEHWKQPRPETGPATLITGRCRRCGRLHPPADPCAPPRQESQQATATAAPEARALIAASKASLCSHGVRPQLCADHDPRRQPKETTDRAAAQPSPDAGDPDDFTPPF